MDFISIRDFAREIAFRSKMAEPATTEELDWFKEGPTVDFLRQVNAKIRQWQMMPVGAIDIDYIIGVVCDFYELTPERLRLRRRFIELVKPRQITMFLAVGYTRMSFAQIGEKLGGFDHSTVSHALKQVRNHCQTEPAFCHEVQQLKELIEQTEP